jgi:hypothetical protein
LSANYQVLLFSLRVEQCW